MNSLNESLELLAAKLLRDRPEAGAAMIRAGKPLAPDRTSAKRIVTTGTFGMERLKAVNDFEARFPDDDAYADARRQYYRGANTNTARTLAVGGHLAKPAGPSQTPPSTPTSHPAFQLRSDRAAITGLTQVAGQPVRAKFDELLAKVEKDDGAGNISEFDFIFGGRSHRVFAVSIISYNNSPAGIKPHTRVVCASWLSNETNDALTRSWFANIRNAIKLRDRFEASRVIKELGSEDGFDTRQFYRNGEEFTSL